MDRLRTLARALKNPSGPEAFAAGIRAFRALFRARYPFHWAELDWIQDSGFWRILERYGEQDGLNAHRRKLLYEYARHATRHLRGDTAECGSFRGLGSHLICRAITECGVSRRHYIFDSFEGLSHPNDTDGRYWSKGDLACDEATVRRNLSDFDFVEYKKGWIPERFPEIADRRFCFVHIDVDLATPTGDSLAFFFPRLEPGGAIVLDDYGFASCPGATKVVDAFIAKEPLASLVGSPVGGGVILNTAHIELRHVQA
jgi:hypothetical protein